MPFVNIYDVKTFKTYAIGIVFDDEFLELQKKVASNNEPKGEHIDFIVQYNDQEKEFSKEDFLKRLGFI